MKVIHKDKKDEFDAISQLVDIGIEERQDLFSLYYVTQLYISHLDKNDNQYGLIKRYQDFIIEEIKQSNREDDLLYRMLHYLQLMKFNEKYDDYKSSLYPSVFIRAILDITNDKDNRSRKASIISISLLKALKENVKDMRVFIPDEMYAIRLDDEMYQRYDEIIPKKKH